MEKRQIVGRVLRCFFAMEFAEDERAIGQYAGCTIADGYLLLLMRG